LTGFISIVATDREGELLTEVSRLNDQTWSLRRQVHKALGAELGRGIANTAVAAAVESPL